HTASAIGNAGVHVVSTPALIGFLEDASHRAILDCYEAGEVSVGTKVDIEHLAAAPLGQPIEATAEVTAVQGRRVDFQVEARQGDRVVMRGRHQRAVVDLARFLAAEKKPR
ncbi:MAG: thioesterase family protein, partial [Hypericibacter sp.]